jgi:Nucleoside diphosphate kinase
MIGATNPQASEPGTIRGDYAIEVGRNVIHGSDSVENAQKEIALWFGGECWCFDRALVVVKKEGGVALCAGWVVYGMHNMHATVASEAGWYQQAYRQQHTRGDLCGVVPTHHMDKHAAHDWCICVKSPHRHTPALPPFLHRGAGRLDAGTQALDLRVKSRD